MKHFSLVLLLSAGRLASQDPVEVESVEVAAATWMTDWEAAKTLAAKDGKDLLIDFTGSDWCIWCKRLKAEVFDQEAFRARAPGSFVLVELDYPQDRSGQSEALQKQNEKLMEVFGVDGFPTIYLADEQGRPYAQTGYQQGGAAPYLEHLAELAAVRAQRDKFLAEAEAAKGVDKAKKLADALDTMDGSMHRHYAEWMDQIIALDADGKGGLKETFEKKKRAMAMASKVQALKSAMNAAAESGDWGKAGQLIDDFLAAPGAADLDAGDRHELLYIRGMVAFRGGDPAKAVSCLEEAKKAAPDHPVNGQIDEILAQMKKQLDGGK
ncbi:MAG: thioredoxin family protein [Planctomycetota bacterium]|nr:thioredoxin family protein [Planctomycetota bacterium]MDA0933052.1 thioredoxin family protein [Planctomycetota bacterium]